MQIIEISINDLNQIIIYLIVFFVVMAVLLICNFNFSRNKINAIEMTRF